ncbi:MAG TPA: 50S ribosomal protein L32 [Chloroflexi bacterium]|nr:50S ribosomal protein L32 [Chloroflexota bacterium]
MGAVPKKKLSRARRDRRRAHWLRLDRLNLVECPQCHELKRPHAVCPSCGTFRGVQYLEVEKGSAG